jgi:hypothetical protein
VELPEVTLLRDARPSRPENSVGIGEFWYEPEVWSLPLSPTSRVLYAGLCSYLGHGEINRRDLRNTLKDCSDEEVAAALQELVRHNLLVREPKENLASYAVLSVTHFDADTDPRSN